MSSPAVLISSSGRRVELWTLFAEAIAELGLAWRVIGADLAEAAPTALVFGNVHPLPAAQHPEFVVAARALMLRENVRLVVPTIDTELPAYAGSAWPDGVLVNISSADAVATASDKLRTAAWLSANALPAPATYPLKDAPPERFEQWVVKPARGSSSIGVQVGVPAAALRELMARPDAGVLIAQEAMSGPEYTVNCFVTRAGVCDTAIPHRRIRTRGGEVSHGVTTHIPAVESLATRAVEALPGAYGAMCVQIIDSRERGPVVIEVNARFGGGYPLAHRAGARFPQRLLREAAGMPHAATAWEPGWEMMRYDQSVFRRIPSA